MKEKEFYDKVLDSQINDEEMNELLQEIKRKLPEIKQKTPKKFFNLKFASLTISPIIIIALVFSFIFLFDKPEAFSGDDYYQETFYNKADLEQYYDGNLNIENLNFKFFTLVRDSKKS